MGQTSLEQQIKDLVDNNTSSGKVVSNIKQEIAEERSDLYEQVREHEIYVNYDFTFDQEEFENLLTADGDFEDIYFNRCIAFCSYNGCVTDLDLTSVESLISDINDLGRKVRKARREIGRLERLLK